MLIASQGIRVGDCGRFAVGQDVTKHWDCPWKRMALDLAFVRGTASETNVACGAP